MSSSLFAAIAQDHKSKTILVQLNYDDVTTEMVNNTECARNT